MSLPEYDPEFDTYGMSDLVVAYKQLENCLMAYEDGEITYATAENWLNKLNERRLKVDAKKLLGERTQGTLSKYASSYDQHYSPSYC